MSNPLVTRCVGLLAVVLASGCAAPQPLPFRLIDAASKVEHGTLYRDSERIEVTIAGQLFSGFYLIASGTAVSQTLVGRRFLPHDTFTTIYSNSARAHLTADNGRQLQNDFLFESERALGECRTPAGETFQLIADGF